MLQVVRDRDDLPLDEIPDHADDLALFGRQVDGHRREFSRQACASPRMCTRARSSDGDARTPLDAERGLEQRPVERDVGGIAVVHEASPREAGGVQQSVQRRAAVGAIADRVRIAFAAAVEASGQRGVPSMGDCSDHPRVVVPGVGSHEDEASAVDEDAAHLGEDQTRMVEMLEHPGRRDDVERRGGKRQILAGADDSMRDDRVAGQRVGVRVDTDDGGLRAHR